MHMDTWYLIDIGWGNFILDEMIMLLMKHVCFDEAKVLLLK